ncbi:acyltransferase domain-containing protein [Streptacidiphilus sp. N1-10]|uniref:Acyltransferase domain-containing protein n=1 Tax=Streptacidiphilus jeojiensis TaxID=3229225 RepID=A0ABV6XHC7_9ACTN
MSTRQDQHTERPERPEDTERPERPRGVALLFPGQGAQQPRMAVGLYRADPSFAARVDRVLALWGAEGRAIRRDWLSDAPRIPLDDLRRAQPLLFAVDWALGRTVLDWGVRPDALLGHSVGEVAAAVLAGVLTLEDAAALMADRVRHLAAAPPGGMLAVAAPVAELEPLLGPDVVVGAVNGPRQVVLAGAEAPLAATEAELRRRGLSCRRARTVSAFHSPVVARAAALSLSALQTTLLRPPHLPLHSGYTAGLLTDDQAVDPTFWAGQPAAPVLFGPALDRLLTAGPLLLVEAGPAQGLTMLAKRHPAVASGRSAAVAMLPARPADGDAEPDAVRAVWRALAEQGRLQGLSSTVPAAAASVGGSTGTRGAP